MLTRSLLVALVASLAVVPSLAQSAGPGERRLGQANYHLTEFEKEVARERGGDRKVWRSKNDALRRIQELKREFPDDPQVESLFQRAKVALLKSKGNFQEIDPAWTVYLNNEAELRRSIWAVGEKAWRDLLATAGTNVLEKVFPAPDSATVPTDAVVGRYVVLNEVRYPMNQFYGGSGEFIFCGKPSEGFYYVQLDGRNWLGAYEAVKRYRRTVDSTMAEVDSWTVLGRISSLTLELPDPNPEKVGALQWGWVVEPIALMVPGHVVGLHQADAPASGVFAGEDAVAAIKESQFTVKSVPADAAPERVMEIFMTAIKEKNYPLYEACIDPERQKTPVAKDLLRYHWDLHQERFHGEYVHAKFGKAVIRVVSGYDKEDDFDNFFLEEQQREKLEKFNGPITREAFVESVAVDPHGKQRGSPTRHRLIQRGNGRWYVEEYATRF